MIDIRHQTQHHVIQQCNNLTSDIYYLKFIYGIAGNFQPF